MLEVKNLRKEYGGLTAVRGISFSLQPGDIFGFIGSNGAGKTTTIRMISTLLEPTGGTAILNGADIRRDTMAVRRMIGYMPDFFGLYDDVKVWEYLDNVLELTDLSVKKNSFVQSLSRGMQQRLCLARCLVHDPQLLLLDEPASGLDPRARAELKELIAELGRMGKIVIVSSHILPELADFCNTVGIIEKGELLACGPVGQIIQGIQTGRVLRIRFLGTNGDLKHFVEGLEHVQSVELAGDGEIRVEFNADEEAQAALLHQIVEARFKVVGFREEEEDLEDVFLRLTTGAVQ
jgi:ABC-2 type transport system ATP-binding protein